MNRINVDMESTIIRLFQQGRSRREIALALDLDRETVGKYVRKAALEAAEGPSAAKPAIVPTGSGADEGAADSPKPAIVPTGISRRKSPCWAHLEVITGKLSIGLTAQRIFQDLRAEAGFKGGYDSVKRFVRHLTESAPKRFERMESLPGREAQIDFGTGAPLVDEQGRRHKTHVFRVVLSHSRKGYSEAVHHQTTEAFIRCLENAFRYFGGVPQTLVIDNLKAAVTQADWYDPVLNPKIELFCRHYGTTVLPTRPYTPRHKGKIERGIGYVKGNALKGNTFGSLVAQNKHLLEWEQTIADQRIHGTTRKQAGKVFLEQERAALLPLPAMPFPSFQEGRRIVHRDGFVEVQKAYYEVPDEYITRQVWVRWDSRLVHVFNHRWEQIMVHARVEPGRFSRSASLDSRGRSCCIERSESHLLQKIGNIGPHCRDWALHVRQERGPAAIRVMLGLLSLTRKHKGQDLEAACVRALSHGAFRLKDLQHLMAFPSEQKLLVFLEEHPVIRSLGEYAALLPPPTTIHEQEIIHV